jgi:nucleotide-binding universal stress UspA family protein
MAGSSRRPGPPRVVVGVDGSEGSLAALAFAAEEARLRGAVLHVVTVHEAEPPRRAPYAPSGNTDEEILAAMTAATVDRAVAAFAAGAVDMHEHVVGRPPAVLLSATEDAVLLVLGRGSDSSVLGPTARACVGGAACPVAVVTPEGVARRMPVVAGVGASHN